MYPSNPLRPTPHPPLGRSRFGARGAWPFFVAGVVVSNCMDLGDPLENAARVPTSIVIVAPQPPFRVLVGNSLQFGAEVRDQAGTTIAGTSIAWTSSVPTVASIDASGLLLAHEVGETTIQATSGDLTSPTITVEVIAIADAIATVVITTPTDARVVVGGTLQFAAEARDAQGVVVPVLLGWVSSIPEVATIDSTGRARGVTPGTTQITATADSLSSAPVVLTVLAQAPDFDTEIQPIFTSRCATSGCHAGANPQAGLRLTLGSAYDAIVDVPSTSLPSWLRVSPSDAAASLLYRKISEDVPPVGSRMPLSGGPLSATEIQRIHDWIEAGAPR